MNTNIKIIYSFGFHTYSSICRSQKLHKPLKSSHNPQTCGPISSMAQHLPKMVQVVQSTGLSFIYCFRQVCFLMAHINKRLTSPDFVSLGSCPTRMKWSVPTSSSSFSRITYSFEIVARVFLSQS